MRKYIVKSMNTGSSKIFTVNWNDQGYIRSAIPIRYYKTRAGAERAARKKENFSF